MTRLVIAVDETGNFLQQKLRGSGSRNRAPSGIAAIVTTQSEKELTRRLQQVARDLDIEYPRHFHARELIDRRERAAMGCALDDEQAAAALETIAATISSGLEDRFGLWGALPGRAFFHEQQAYGEMLLALLALVRERWSKRLAACEAVEIRVASRNHQELVGFVEPADYVADLEVFLTATCRKDGWPKSTTVVVASASRDPYLIAADFFAWAARSRPDWVIEAKDAHLPSSHQAALAALRRIDIASSVFLRLGRGEKVDGEKLFAQPSQTSHQALKRLTEIAHAQVRDRHGEGDLDLALVLAEWIWPWAATANAASLRGELCTVAHEVLSHQGRTAADPTGARWRERAKGLGVSAWGTNTIASRAARLEYRCQTVQSERFNVFDFEGAYLEFCDEVTRYEELAGGVEEIGATDELYGKLLGTVGQACGFLRAIDGDVGAEAMGYLERSAPYFADSEPLFRAMSVGFRLTDCWDRGELEAAEALLDDRDASSLGPYDLLHRLRLAAARKASGEAGATGPLVGRAVELLEEGSAGKTPFDLCAKWALYLAPENAALRSRAARWSRGLGTDHVAILATSLPLLAQLGEWQRARGHLHRLKAHPGFQAFWETSRAEPLKRTVTDETSPTFEALRGMPWNYA